MIGTGRIGSFKSNYHTITTTPYYFCNIIDENKFPTNKSLGIGSSTTGLKGIYLIGFEKIVMQRDKKENF